MTSRSRQSPFIEPAAVEAWDAWFRWRHHAHLCDVSIEDTWRRVASALAAVEARGARGAWFSRFLKPLAGWQLLPDERLLAAADTGRITWRGGALGAVLNVAAFAARDHAGERRVDPDDIAHVAAVAVRGLDNAAMLAGEPAPRLRIGLTGVADALALLDCAYDSATGRALAATWARALAEGCFLASAELAVERGPVAGDAGPVLERAMVRGFAPHVVRSASRHGLRHRKLTAIAPHPRLALFANDVADALDPLQDDPHARTITAPEGNHTLDASGYALNVLRGDRQHTGPLPATLATLPWTAQIGMRAAVQPWMDEPIACPLLFAAEPDAQMGIELLQHAAMHGLAAPTWRVASAPARNGMAALRARVGDH